MSEQTLTPEHATQGYSQYLTFVLGDEEYAVNILRVQEIRSWEPVSRVPNVPVYEKGVINLRGAIVPIIDLRERFELGRAVYTPVTAVIILQLRHDQRKRIMGMVVDHVANVIDIGDTQIQTSPDFGKRISTECITGIAAVNERMIILLDIDKLLSLSDSSETGT